jgi:hypothetical protein
LIEASPWSSARRPPSIHTGSHDRLHMRAAIGYLIQVIVLGWMIFAVMSLFVTVFG